MRLALTDADPADLLGVYLNDHLAGAAVGHELARRCLRRSKGTPLGGDLEALVGQIREDRATLVEVMKRLGVSRNGVKQVAGLVAERVGRLKLNGQLLGYSALSRLVEIEGMCAGVDAKRSMWRSLERVAPSRPELAGVDLNALADRAEQQRRMLEEHRLEAAGQAFVRR